MIVPMFKYGFLVYHRDYEHFLDEIQKLGVLHIIGKEQACTEEIIRNTALSGRFAKAIRFLEKRATEKAGTGPEQDPVKILDEIDRLQNQLECLEQEHTVAHAELRKALPWGDFSHVLIRKLNSNNLHVKFFTASPHKFAEHIEGKFTTEIISQDHQTVHFMVVWQGAGKPKIDAEEVHLPERTASELQEQIGVMEQNMAEINHAFAALAAGTIDLLKNEKEKTRAILEFDQAICDTRKEFDEKLMILEGWVPLTNKKRIDHFLIKNEILFVSNKAKPSDKAPIQLRNNRFSQLFEPIGGIFSLPAYSELDLTVFFAPFFMMFFGFCLGDAGYGLLFIVGASLYKLKAPKSFRPYLTLIQFLGAATVLFGFISGTLFGINLIEADRPVTKALQSLFFDPAKMFNLALVLGAVQIVFGMAIKAANQIKQYGFTYSLGTIGWLFLILSVLIYILLVSQKVIVHNKLWVYLILAAGGFFILFFSDPEGSVFMRLGKGVWNVYSTVTGIFGDLLSYIRLFAIGLSSSILGYVINDIGLTILHASPLIGPVLFGLFLILGHTLNILISSLGSFVHPMRLTFVEFYKNAGFTGGGKEYKPFSKASFSGK